MYNYEKKLDGTNSAHVILSHVLKMVPAKTAIDVGCGRGAFALCLKEMGVRTSAMDGEWFCPEAMNAVGEKNFIIHNLDDGAYKSDKRYDLAVCLEVAEHIIPSQARNVVETLVGLSDVILFSAAIPGQGGQGHVNEQWPSYWQERFNMHGYDFADVVRPAIWTDKSVFRWYRQNTFIVAKTEILPKIYEKFRLLKIRNGMLDVVHPDYWHPKVC